MSEKRFSIPVMLAAVILTAFFTAIASRWYFINQKADGYKSQLTARVLSNDGMHLTIQGDITNNKGTNGTYVVKYNSGVTVYDSSGNEIAFSDLQPDSHISIYYMWSIPRYVFPHTEWRDLFALEESQNIPDVLAIARLEDGESGKPIDFFDPSLTATP